MNTLTPLEERVTRMLLAGDDDVLTILRRQLEKANVSSREMTGVGFYTNFAVASEVERVPTGPSFKLGDVNGVADNLQHGVGFLLYIKDGLLDMLEAYTYGEPWPQEVLGLKLTYASGENRDMDIVKHLLHP